jgi:hypothetical protein
MVFAAKTNPIVLRTCDQIEQRKLNENNIGNTGNAGALVGVNLAGDGSDIKISWFVGENGIEGIA